MSHSKGAVPAQIIWVDYRFACHKVAVGFWFAGARREQDVLGKLPCPEFQISVLLHKYSMQSALDRSSGFAADPARPRVLHAQPQHAAPACDRRPDAERTGRVGAAAILASNRYLGCYLEICGSMNSRKAELR